jgi:hypothetical protein
LSKCDDAQHPLGQNPPAIRYVERNHGFSVPAAIF